MTTWNRRGLPVGVNQLASPLETSTLHHALSGMDEKDQKENVCSCKILIENLITYNIQFSHALLKEMDAYCATGLQIVENVDPESYCSQRCRMGCS